jgi:hypothetical protein
LHGTNPDNWIWDYFCSGAVSTNFLTAEEAALVVYKHVAKADLGRMECFYGTAFLPARAQSNTSTALPISLENKYLASVYWAITTMTTVGYGDISPSSASENELYLTCFLEAFGTAIFAYVIGNVMSLVMEFDPAARHLRAKLLDLSDYLQSNSMPKSDLKGVKAHTEFFYSIKSVFDQSMLFSVLPQNLRNELVMHVSSTNIGTIDFFREMEYDYPGFISKIYTLIKPVFVTRNKYVIKAGDMGREMFFVFEGTVNIFEKDADPAGEPARTINKNDYFGEAVLCVPEKVSFKVKQDAYTLVDSYMFAISRNNIDEICSMGYYDMAEHMKKVLKAHKSHDDYIEVGGANDLKIARNEEYCNMYLKDLVEKDTSRVDFLSDPEDPISRLTAEKNEMLKEMIREEGKRKITSIAQAAKMAQNSSPRSRDVSPRPSDVSPRDPIQTDVAKDGPKEDPAPPVRVENDAEKKDAEDAAV